MRSFFLEHGFHADPIQVRDPPAKALPLARREESARQLVRRLQEATEFAQAALASAQSRSEDAANRRRRGPERYEVGDLVWLDIGNYRSPRPSKKIDWLYRKYRVVKVLGSHTVELDVDSGIWPRFHVDILRRASCDPLPGQTTTDPQPAPLINEDDELEFEVQEILCARNKRRGRGSLRVRWRGYERPTWEPVENLTETEALDHWGQYGSIDTNNGLLDQYVTQQKTRTKFAHNTTRKRNAGASSPARVN